MPVTQNNQSALPLATCLKVGSFTKNANNPNKESVKTEFYEMELDDQKSQVFTLFESKSHIFLDRICYFLCKGEKFTMRQSSYRPIFS
ncbi:MAG: hypothetical protein LBC85_05490 [Fibromonadaceae bacterium]|jgi:hypothetical protein|nr:hypothetical protein [Fibromonadaceae bacterium]